MREAGALLVAAAASAFGLVRAAQLFWVCDDAFISFRYADNLVRGLGLVFNAGERVEGYTNLSWTLLVAAAMARGADPVVAAQWMGLGCYLALLAVLVHAWWETPAARRAPLPLAALLAAAMPDFHVWASGGLETMLFTALATHTLLEALRWRGSVARAAQVGALCGSLVLTRPDGLLFALVSLAALARRPAASRRAVVAAVTAFGALLALLVAFKLSYYGELLPTAFHAKSAARPYWSQGLLYLALFAAGNWALTLLSGAVVAAVVVGRRLALLRDARVAWPAAAALLFLGYVVHSGGDFMSARRLVPLVPLLLLAVERLLALLGGRRAFAAVVLASLGASLPYPVFTAERRRIHGIADERSFYPPEAIAARRRQAQVAALMLEGAPVRAMFEGGMCVFAYYSRLPYLVEMTGLTQYSLAQQPLAQRGPIGHEKQADEAWLREHRIHLVFSRDFPQIEVPAGGPLYDEVFFADVLRARVVVYSDDVMDRLRAWPLARFQPIEALFAQAHDQIRADPARGPALRALLDRFYFDAAGERGRALRARLPPTLASGP